MEDSCIQMKMYMKDNEKMIKPMGMVFTLTKQELNMPANGKMIFNMVKEQKLGLIIQNLQDNMTNVENMVKALTLIKMELYIKDYEKMIKKMAKGSAFI